MCGSLFVFIIFIICLCCKNKEDIVYFMNRRLADRVSFMNRRINARESRRVLFRRGND